MDPKAISALQAMTEAISDVQRESYEIARIVARRYYWEQLTIRAKVKAASATVMAMASHPFGGLVIWSALERQRSAREEVKRCQKQLDRIYAEMDGVTTEAIAVAQQVTLRGRTKDRKTVKTIVSYANPAQHRQEARSVNRDMPMRLVYWICVICQREWYEIRYPNKIPVYCPPTPEEAAHGLMSECQRKGLAEKQHKYHVRLRLQEDARQRARLDLEESDER